MDFDPYPILGLVLTTLILFLGFRFGLRRLTQPKTRWQGILLVVLSALPLVILTAIELDARFGHVLMP